MDGTDRGHGPQRPRAHILEEQSKIHLRTAFASLGWTTEDLKEDYGEDLLVRIFEDGRATQYAFFVQAKATDRLERYFKQSMDEIRYPIKLGHIKHWVQFWEPVFLTLWDSKSSTTYWVCVQDWFDAASKKGPSPKSYVSIPTKNVLDTDGLWLMNAITKRRFERFKQEKAEADVLISLISEKLHVKIDYDAQNGILMIHKRDGKMEGVVFGRMAESSARLAKALKVTEQEVISRALEFTARIVKEFESGRVIGLADKQGKIVAQWKTFTELSEHVE